MLSDREQRVLQEVQRQFLAEDPDFALSFDEVGQRDSAYSLHWVYALPRWVHTTAIVGALAFGLLMLAVEALGAAGTALVFAMLVTTILVVGGRRGAPGSAET